MAGFQILPRDYSRSSGEMVLGRMDEYFAKKQQRKAEEEAARQKALEEEAAYYSGNLGKLTDPDDREQYLPLVPEHLRGRPEFNRTDFDFQSEEDKFRDQIGDFAREDVLALFKRMSDGTASPEDHNLFNRMKTEAAGGTAANLPGPILDTKIDEENYARPEGDPMRVAQMRADGAMQTADEGVRSGETRRHNQTTEGLAREKWEDPNVAAKRESDATWADNRANQVGLDPVAAAELDQLTAGWDAQIQELENNLKIANEDPKITPASGIKGYLDKYNTVGDSEYEMITAKIRKAQEDKAEAIAKFSAKHLGPDAPPAEQISPPPAHRPEPLPSAEAGQVNIGGQNYSIEEAVAAASQEPDSRGLVMLGGVPFYLDDLLYYLEEAGVTPPAENAQLETEAFFDGYKPPGS